MQQGDPVLGGFYLIFIIALYFVPGIVATYRKCKSSAGIRLLTIFLGWSGLGRLIALIRAVSGDVNEVK